MGLDQYAFKVKTTTTTNNKGEKVEKTEKTEIAYWRKHANLNGWMTDLYYEKGGEDDFNCQELELDEDDLYRLESVYRDLPTATGFFWGESNAEDDDATGAFIENALKAIQEGYTIIYYCWW